MVFKLRLYKLAISLRKKGARNFLNYLPLSFCTKLFLKSISKKTNNDENEIIINELVQESPVFARVLSFLSCMVNFFDDSSLNIFPHFNQTFLTKNEENEKNITKKLKELDFLKEKAFILFLLKENVKKKPNNFNKNILNTISYILKKIDFETDLRFEAADASAISDDFYSDDKFQPIEVDWIKTSENVLVYEKLCNLRRLENQDVTLDLIYNLYKIFYKMVFVKGYFNFNFSKENLAITEDNKISFLDYSTSIRVKEEDKEIIKNIALMLLDKNYSELYKFFKKHGFIVDSSDDFINIFNLENNFFGKFNALCKNSNKINLKLPIECFFILYGFKEIKKLSNGLNIDENLLEDYLKNMLLTEKKDFFYFNVDKDKSLKFPEFAKELKQGLEKKPLMIEKKYFFQKDEPKCIRREKRLSRYSSLIALLFLIFWILYFQLKR